MVEEQNTKTNVVEKILKSRKKPLKEFKALFLLRRSDHLQRDFQASKYVFEMPFKALVQV